jgi:hypothetical protein
VRACGRETDLARRLQYQLRISGEVALWDAFMFFRARQYGACGIEPCVLVPESIREWFRCHVLQPLLRALGVASRRDDWRGAWRLAWSSASIRL